MAIQWMDGFDHYGSGDTVGPNNMLAGPWANVSLGNIGAPSWGARTGDFAISSLNNSYRRIIPTPDNQIFVSMGFSLGGLPGADFESNIINFRNGSNVDQLKLYVTNTGRIQLTDVNEDILATTSGPVITTNNWHFLEMLYDGDAGLFVLRIDDATGSDTPVISVSVGDLGNTGSLVFGPGQQGAFDGTTIWWDDILVRDMSGGINDDWLGDRRVATLFANADSTPMGWTPSYLQKFGTGIYRNTYLISGDPDQQADQAYLYASASTDLDIGSADFTLETMIRFDVLPVTTTYQTIFGRWDAAMNRRSYRLVYGGPGFNNNCIQFDTSTDGGSGTVETKVLYPWLPKTNTWYHLALCRSAGELLLFVDGVQLGLPITDGDTYYGGGSERFLVGREQSGGGNNFVANSHLIGYLDETRFTNGTGRYTSTFTPPSQAFPRSGTDPDWAEVVLLMGYEDSVVDESSFGRTITLMNNGINITPNDGPDTGVYSTINEEAPYDGNFIEAAYEYASNILTMTTQPSDGDTITLGTTDGATPAVYTFKNTMAAIFDVQIGATAQDTLENFMNAVNAGPGAGTAYFTGTTSNFDVIADLLPIGQISVEAIDAGTGGNSIASTETGSAAVWDSATLTGGTNIPGPSTFTLERPPRNTTVISGVQLVVRALKSDAGLATIQTHFIGGLGAEFDGDTHNLTVSPQYYQDIMEEDPDTTGPVTPTTLINGKFQINRTQ